MYRQILKLFILSQILLTFVTGANAWDACFQDTSYIDEYEVSLAPGDVVHGQALVPGSPSYPAAISGAYYRSVNWIVFFIDYNGMSLSRYYEWNVTDMTVRTWLAYDDGTVTSEETHTFVHCGASEEIARSHVSSSATE